MAPILYLKQDVDYTQTNIYDLTGKRRKQQHEVLKISKMKHKGSWLIRTHTPNPIIRLGKMALLIMCQMAIKPPLPLHN